jgi:hypothetical protein
MRSYTVRAVSHRDGTHVLYEKTFEARTGDDAYVQAYREEPELLGSTRTSMGRLVTVEIEPVPVVLSMGEPCSWETA